MKHAIDPKIDCVFKALLGAEHNRRLLLHFLNAILAGELNAPLTEVEILNPYNEREFIDDKLSVVDVKARDSNERLYQIEIQLLNSLYLPARILYGWADLYSAQLQDGQGYENLHPTYAIWLLGQTLRPRVSEAIHRFRLRDEQGRSLFDHGGVWLLELSKCVVERVETEQQRWLKFFIEGSQLDDQQLPAWMHTEEMQQAMSTLRGFSEKERAYHRYQARQNFLREQKSLQQRLQTLQAEAERARAAEAQERAEKEAARTAEEQARAAEAQERAEKEAARAAEAQERAEKEAARTAEAQERAEKEAALAEIERLKALLPPSRDV
jgi:predicted transposase/invertase (TIGR01784 family)